MSYWKKGNLDWPSHDGKMASLRNFVLSSPEGLGLKSEAFYFNLV